MKDSPTEPVEPEAPKDERDEQSGLGAWRDAFRQFAIYSHVGMMFPVATAIGFFAGYYVDRWLGTSPWLAILGLALGVAAAIRNLLRTVAIEDDQIRRSR